MFFRFCAALTLIVLIAAAGVAVQKRMLDLQRTRTLQQYRLQQLEEKYAKLKLRSQELGAPGRLMESLRAAELERAAQREKSRAKVRGSR